MNKSTSSKCYLRVMHCVVMVFPVTFLVLHVVHLSYAANILALNPPPMYSHQIAFRDLWKELSLRGHNVTVVTTDPVNDKTLTNLSEIDMKWSYRFFPNVTSSADSFSMWSLPQSFRELFLTIAREQLSYPPIQDLVHNRTFDVVFVEYFFPEYLTFAEVYQCPKILFASMDVYAHLHSFMGNPSHPVLYPELGTPFHGNLTFRERVISTLFSWYMSYFYSYKGYTEREKLVQKYLNTNASLINIFSDIDLMILNINPVIHGARALGPTTISIGGHRPSVSSGKPLQKDLKEFLDGAKDGFIYFSLGSNVKSRELGKRTLKSIIAALSEIPYKIVWKFEANDLPGKPSNVRIVEWAPQQQILAHPNIKLFITQGGLQSMEESIYNEVPFVVIPFFGDQYQNANLMLTKGIARVVDRKPFIKKEDLKAAILEVIKNPSYKRAVQDLKRFALDTPMTGLEKAVWWTEYVIRNNGTKHLRNPAADIPTYQYYLLDVIGFLVLVATLAVWVLIVTLKILIRSLKKLMYGKSDKLKEQ